jgi:hypothetical protein
LVRIWLVAGICHRFRYLWQAGQKKVDRFAWTILEINPMHPSRVQASPARS